MEQGRERRDKHTKPGNRHRIPREQVPCGKLIKSNSANKEFNLLLQTCPSLHPGILSEIKSQYSGNIAQLVEHFT